MADKKNSLDEALKDIENGEVETFTNEEFDKQINDLMKNNEVNEK